MPRRPCVPCVARGEEEQWEEGEARESSTNISHGPVLSVEVIRCGAGCTAAHSGSTAAGGLLLGFSAKRFLVTPKRRLGRDTSDIVAFPVTQGSKREGVSTTARKIQNSTTLVTKVFAISKVGATRSFEKQYWSNLKLIV